MEQYGWIGFVASLAALVWYLYYAQRGSSITSEEPVSTPTTEDQESIEVTLDAKSLLNYVLDKLNLCYEDVDDFTYFTYRGEHFRVVITDNPKHIHIQDNYWYKAPLNDLENMVVFQRALNRCNKNGFNLFYYTEDHESDSIYLHSIHALLWIPEIPYIEQYFLSALDYMLRCHSLFYENMEEVRREHNATAIEQTA